MSSLYSHLECVSCHAVFDKNQLQSYCHQCTQPLFARYAIDPSIDRSMIDTSTPSMWRYRHFLPIEQQQHIICLGEGFTPIHSLSRISSSLGLDHAILMKDESHNPTGSFKARGMSVAISKAFQFGIKSCCTPTAGNAGSALAAYCAKADMTAKVYMPERTPEVFAFDARLMGAEVIKVDGSIRDAGLLMHQDNHDGAMWDVSTMKEPFRLEGKKTMGYEIAEQLEWELPDVIFYPTGGGTGLIGIWKAFLEMHTMHWIKKPHTRMIAVQMDMCAPIIDAFVRNKANAELCLSPGITIANGLRVPKAFADRAILETIYSSNGSAISVSEEAMISGLRTLAQQEGHFICPEGAALIPAIQYALDNGIVRHDEKIMMINTGSGYKYIENLIYSNEKGNQ